MATPTQSSPPGGTPPKPARENTFTRNLRYEFADEEGRVLLNSYAVAIALAIVWLVLVHVYKPTANPLAMQPEKAPISVSYVPPVDSTVPEPVPAAESPAPSPAPTRTPTAGVPNRGPRNLAPGPRGPRGSPRPGRPGSRTETSSAGAVGPAFGTGSGSGTGGLVGDVSGILRGVDVASGSGGTGGGRGGTGGGGAGGKTVLGYGEGGEGARTPGRGGIGGGTGTGGGQGGGVGGIGRVGGGGGGITAARVRVPPPRVVAAENLGGPSRDVNELGAFVRSRESQLRFCYQERGLKVNPNLAGTITVAITLTGSGNVTGVDVTNSTMSGAGASETQSCIRSRIRSWKFPSSSAGGGTYAFPFNFTR